MNPSLLFLGIYIVSFGQTNEDACPTCIGPCGTSGVRLPTVYFGVPPLPIS